jgi:signal transduction histidine kinase
VTSLIASLSELAAAVQRGRTIDSVLEIAGNGALRIGIRLVAFQFSGSDLVLRYLATPKPRLAAIESNVGKPVQGLRAPLADSELMRAIIEGRRAIYREDLDLFDRFLRDATSFDATPLDAVPETAGITNGVVAPLFVREQPWGVLSLVSRTFARDDADAVALFATHLASSIEIAENTEALARAQAELVARERLAALGELAAVVAHEIRNPLGALFNSLGSLRRLLAEGERDEGEAELLLSIANEEATRLNGIVSDLLDFARPGVPSLQPASLGEVIEDAARASDAVIDLDVQPDLPNVLMDPRLMRQALVNLLLNGIQSMPDQDPTMRVCARREGDSTVRIDVTDHGAGISASDRERIFEPFFTTKASGTGLGLAVVKRIVDSHLGTIEVSSAPTGTTFTLRFPVATADLGR